MSKKRFRYRPMVAAPCSAPWRCGDLRWQAEMGFISDRERWNRMCRACKAPVEDYFWQLDTHNGFVRHYSAAELDRMEADYEVTQRMAPLG